MVSSEQIKREAEVIKPYKLFEPRLKKVPTVKNSPSMDKIVKNQSVK